MGGGTEWMSVNVLGALVANFARNRDLCPHLPHFQPHKAEKPVLLCSKKRAFGFLEASILQFGRLALWVAHHCLWIGAKVPTFGMQMASGTSITVALGALLFWATPTQPFKSGSCLLWPMELHLEPQHALKMSWVD